LQLLEKKGIQYLNSEVQNIDVINKQAKTSVKSISYDFLVFDRLICFYHLISSTHKSAL